MSTAYQRAPQNKELIMVSSKKNWLHWRGGIMFGFILNCFMFFNSFSIVIMLY